VSAAAPVTPADFVTMLASDLTNNDLELPTFPDAVVRIQQSFQKDDTDANEIVRIISSDPALAATVIKIANSAAVRTSANEIVDVRKAVLQMGFKLIQNCAISFALRQLERNARLSEQARTALKGIWTESVELAARSFVIAKHYTKLNAEEAMLAGLLSVLGRLYIFMKSIEYPDISYSELDEVLREWHPAIARAIAETWGMSDELANALENQLQTDLPVEETATLCEVLIAARVVYQHEVAQQALDGTLFPILQRLGICSANDVNASIEEFRPQIDNIKNALMK
jgi:HD-like signal output (HDOD) protein